MLGERISTKKVAALAAAARQAGKTWLQFDPDVVRSSYNRAAFLVNHRLAEHPHFTWPSIASLCRRLGEQRVFCRIGKIPVDAEFDKSPEQFNGGLSLEDAIAHLEEREAYIVVNNPERDPEYRGVIEGLLGEIAAQTEPIDPGMNWFSTYLFISAQDAVTPYHMDREMNFLLQIRGRKTAKLWDPLDDEIISQAQRDLLLSRIGPRPGYKPSFESKARIFELRPGLGVHHPFIAPHLVHTGKELSISLAITFRTHQSDVWTNAHKFNRRLRRLGINPHPVGQTAFVDSAKSAVVQTWQQAAGVVRRGGRSA